MSPIGEYHYNGIVTPGGVPAIVPEDIFNRANELIETNKRAPARKKAKEEYLLTTKLFCGHCQAMMVGESGQKSNGNIYRYYKCAGAKKHVCDKKSVRKEWIEEVVLKLIMQTLMNDEMLQKVVDRIMELQKAENTVIPALERQLSEVLASIENIVKAIEMGVFTRSTKVRLEELEAEEERIKGDICREQLESRLVTEEQIWYIFDKFKNMDLSMPQQRQKILDSFLHSIVLYDDRLVISFNYREKEKTLKLDQLVEFIHSHGSDLGSAASLNSPGCMKKI